MSTKFYRKALGFLGLVSIVAVLVLIPAMNVAVANFTKQANAKPVHKYKSNVLHLEFNSGSYVSLANGSFSGGPAGQTSRLNAILDSVGQIKAEKLSHAPNQTSLARKLDGALSNYYKVVLGNDADMSSLIRALKSLSIIKEAYAEPTPAPA